MRRWFWLGSRVVNLLPTRRLPFSATVTIYPSLFIYLFYVDHCIKVRRAMSSTVDRNLFRIPNDTPVVGLNCKDAFQGLTSKEALYAHYIARASFEGALIVFLQVSPESAAIFVTLHRLFSTESVESLKNKAITQAGVSEEEWTNLLTWAASFYSNSGNYKGFGDSKMVPDIAPEKLRKLVSLSDASSKYPELMATYTTIEENIFSVHSKNCNLGFPDVGVTTYLGENITRSDSDLINRFMKEKGLEGWNTRLFKEEKNGKVVYYIKLAGANHTSRSVEFEGVTVVVEAGEYTPLLKRVASLLREASKHAANDTEKRMCELYADHFLSGDINEHKNASRLWIKDQGPVVENYIGFIENYRDPAGVRSEFEGFVAVVNKDTSKKFGELVKNAEEILKRLPWGASYEKDAFLKPDFSALDVLAFGSSGIPAGINIPNYDDIRQNEGFKNVSLSNVISAMPKQKMNFISAEDEDIIFTYNGRAFEVQVGLHELLGHGSGKLFQKKSDGSFNFDHEMTVDLITGQKVSSWYEEGETWGGKFGQLACAYEECRAEAVGYVLCVENDILKIFGHEGEEAEKVKYCNWLSQIRAGLLALEFYAADMKKWGQAHCWARFILTKVCLEAGQAFVTIEETVDSEGKADLVFRLEKSKIESVGVPAVREFLKKLQAYKSTADVEGATALFNRYGSVSEEELRWREVCIARRKPRRIFVQPNTSLDDKGTVKLTTYPESVEGIIQSFVQRYSSDVVSELESLWKDDRKYFPSAYARKH